MQNTNQTCCGKAANQTKTQNTNELHESFFNARCVNCLAHNRTCKRKMLYQDFTENELYVTANTACDFETAVVIAEQCAIYGFKNATDTPSELQRKTFKVFLPMLAHELQQAKCECEEHKNRYAFDALKMLLAEYVQSVELESEWKNYYHEEN